MGQAEGGVKIFGVFRVKNHYFMPKYHTFSNCGGRRENCWVISCKKSRFYTKKSYFFQLRREARKLLGYFVWKITVLPQKFIFFPILGVRPALDPPLIMSGLIKDCINLPKASWQIANEINGLTYFVNSVNVLTKREKPFIKSR